MNPFYKVKHWLKLGRWRYRRAIVSIRFGATILENTPVVLGNAMPKSGSHLIIQVLQGLSRLGPFVNPGFPPVNRSEDNSKLSEKELLRNIQRMRPGDIGYGYIHAEEPFITTLTQPNRATIFVSRDPRDMIVSHVFYATQMHAGHGMHHYYNEKLQTMEERINAAIAGVKEPGAELTPIRAKYEHYLGWLDQPDVLCLRFEDLILDQENSLGHLLDYLSIRDFTPKSDRPQAILTLQNAIAPGRSGTYRKGKPGNWREYFTDANKSLFKENTGDLLIRMGYEEDQNW
jgi:hypothetical protein